MAHFIRMTANTKKNKKLGEKLSNYLANDDMKNCQSEKKQRKMIEKGRKKCKKSNTENKNPKKKIRFTCPYRKL